MSNERFNVMFLCPDVRRRARGWSFHQTLSDAKKYAKDCKHSLQRNFLNITTFFFLNFVFEFRFFFIEKCQAFPRFRSIFLFLAGDFRVSPSRTSILRRPPHYLIYKRNTNFFSLMLLGEPQQATQKNIVFHMYVSRLFFQMSVCKVSFPGKVRCSSCLF